MPEMRECDPEVREMLQRVLDKSHKDLVEAGVTFGLYFVFAKTDKNGMVKGPALKLHGYPCLATVKINSVGDRIEGKTDVTIKLDGDQWADLPEEKQIATLDHECEHLQLARDKEGQIKTDEAFRPKLKIRLHDIVIGGFWSIVRRHKENAVESMQYVEIAREFKQQFFPWIAAMEENDLEHCA